MTGPTFSAIRRPVENTPSSSCSRCGPWWRLPLLLGLVLAAIVWSRMRSHPDNPQSGKDHPAPAASASSGDKVSLAIDFGGGRRKKFDAIAWHDGMTVADLLNATPGVAITQKGSGQSALLTAIDGVENQGATADNWTYSVNGPMADRSFAVYKLRPGDQVLWTFGPPQ